MDAQIAEAAPSRGGRTLSEIKNSVTSNSMAGKEAAESASSDGFFNDVAHDLSAPIEVVVDIDQIHVEKNSSLGARGDGSD
ncbi:MAG TPA: hypothetical protein VFR86_23625 [Burkholderiaceae bacterium]|nr:hypothetical protein [Burkholderiaceae bacterium]